MKMKSCLFRLLGVAILVPLGLGTLYFMFGDWNAVLHGILVGIAVIVVAALLMIGLWLVLSGADDNPGDDQCL